MRPFIAAILALAVATAAAAGQPVPRGSQGYWVPANSSCKSELGIRVTGSSVEFVNRQQRKLFNTEACFSCEGGAQYSGVVIWVAPRSADNKAFTLYLNADEQEGVARIDLESAPLRSAFPLHDVALKRCEN